MRSCKSAFLLVLLLTIPAFARTGPPIDPDKKIIHLFQYWPDAKYLRDNITRMQSLPFDGFVIQPTAVIDGKETPHACFFHWWEPKEIGEEAMAGMIDLVRKGFFRKDERVLFVHTGGVPALYATGDLFFQ